MHAEIQRADQLLTPASTIGAHRPALDQTPAIQPSTQRIGNRRVRAPLFE